MSQINTLARLHGHRLRQQRLSNLPLPNHSFRLCRGAGAHLADNAAQAAEAGAKRCELPDVKYSEGTHAVRQTCQAAGTLLLRPLAPQASFRVSFVLHAICRCCRCCSSSGAPRSGEKFLLEIVQQAQAGITAETCCCTVEPWTTLGECILGKPSSSR